MANAAKPVAQVKQKMSKSDRAIRQQTEDKVVTNNTKPKPASFLNKDASKVFHKLKKLNDNFTEGDSHSLSLLARNIYRYTLLNVQLDEMDVLDEESINLEKRIHAYEKAIHQNMVELCIPLSQRLKLANDMAKTLIEEKKLEAMNNKPVQEGNPLLSLLKELN
ncbi:hypothetical protein COL39_13025 [Bacillus cereus]|uniref:hypothetical protein n=1 Tax=Bacillus cereus TaxID=1396 RepID=UPI000BFA76A9|nr:hypothetical protein [Bacillus cereus]PFX73751.1 hypothetical protein COL39_13025 [Bacillus cereus]